MGKIETFANARILVEVDEKDFIQKLIENEIGRNGWVFKEGETFYRGYEVARTIDGKESISKEKYDYIISLENALEYLKSKTG